MNLIYATAIMMGVTIVQGKCCIHPHGCNFELCPREIIAIHRSSIHSTGDFLRGYPEGGSSSAGRHHRALYYEKLSAAQKRQNQRDYRRQFTNPFRTEAEEHAERQRKHEQGLLDPARDPDNRQFGFHEYAFYREQDRADRCTRTGRGCNYHALDWDNQDKRYDYDPWHGEHYSGTPYDHDVNYPGGNS